MNTLFWHSTIPCIAIWWLFVITGIVIGAPGVESTIHDSTFDCPHAITTVFCEGEGNSITKRVNTEWGVMLISNLTQNYQDTKKTVNSMAKSTVSPAESQLWRDFANGDRTKLPDFSYAGYKRGETQIPDVDWPIYNVGYLQGSGGNVIWRYQFHPDTGPDFHSYSICSSLYDLTEGGLRRKANGEARYGRPNHLKHFALWNHSNTDPTRGDRVSSSDPTPEYDKYVWWTLSPSCNYVTPIVVGAHGQPLNFLTSGIGRIDTLEHNGRDDVTPRSLYEALRSV